MLFADAETVVDEAPPDPLVLVCLDHEKRPPVKPPRPDSAAARWWRDAYREECRESAQLAARLEQEERERRVMVGAHNSLLDTITRMAAEHKRLRDRVAEMEGTVLRLLGGADVEPAVADLIREQAAEVLDLRRRGAAG